MAPTQGAPLCRAMLVAFPSSAVAGIGCFDSFERSSLAGMSSMRVVVASFEGAEGLLFLDLSLSLVILMGLAFVWFSFLGFFPPRGEGGARES